MRINHYSLAMARYRGFGRFGEVTTSQKAAALAAIVQLKLAYANGAAAQFGITLVSSSTPGVWYTQVSKKTLFRIGSSGFFACSSESPRYRPQ